MKKTNLTKDQKHSLISSIIVLVLGILFCCSLAMGVKGISILLGISMIIVGIMYLINSSIKNKSLLNVDGVIASAIIAFGVMFTVRQMAGIIFDFIPFLLIVFGACIIVDALLKKLYLKTIDASKFLGELLIGLIMLALGLCLKFVAGFSDFASLILGIVLIVYAVVSICDIVLKNTKNEKIEQENK